MWGINVGLLKAITILMAAILGQIIFSSFIIVMHIDVECAGERQNKLINAETILIGKKRWYI